MIRRLLMGLTVTALVAAGCGGNTGSTGSSSSTPEPSAQTATLNLSEFKIDLSPSSLKAGDYTFEVKNAGEFPHDVHFATPDGSEVAKSPVLQKGQSGTVEVNLKAGTYTLWCAVDAHRARGMET